MAQSIFRWRDEPAPDPDQIVEDGIMELMLSEVLDTTKDASWIQELHADMAKKKLSRIMPKIMKLIKHYYGANEIKIPDMEIGELETAVSKEIADTPVGVELLEFEGAVFGAYDTVTGQQLRLNPETNQWEPR